ncbi:polysulfide reductase [Acidobacteria bacterium AB60]|nr:polysulfide reductase [Acidobacteria bacterium AB60]
MASIPEINDARDVFSQISPSYDIVRSAQPERVHEPGYYGLPILKRPFWKWEIALYFFFEGVSAGTSVLCSVLRATRGRRHREMIRAGRTLSFATMLVCPPLLIADLGRPERFHHMLRIWKKTSPMNHGAWALTGYGLLSTIQLCLIWPAWRLPFGKRIVRLLQRLLPESVVDVLGMPFALTMISYPGVLLSTTANPVWSHTHFLGSLFAASSMSNGAAALALLSARCKDEDLHRSIGRFEDAATTAEAAALALYLGTAKKAARPLFKGKQSGLFLIGAIGLGIVAPALLRRARSPVLRSVVAPLLSLAGGAALKWAITYAGQESAMDVELANHNAPMIEGQAQTRA